jgi:hypothetical protein
MLYAAKTDALTVKWGRIFGAAFKVWKTLE